MRKRVMIPMMMRGSRRRRTMSARFHGLC
jgi:hypothetical protein